MSTYCLLLVFAILHKAMAHGTHRHHDHHHARDTMEQTQSHLLQALDKYLYTNNNNSLQNSIISFFLILSVPPILIKLLPRKIVQPIMTSNKTLLFSLGSVLGELFLHSLPSLYFQTTTSGLGESTSFPEIAGIAIFIGYAVFYTLDKFLLLSLNKWVSGDGEHAHFGHSHSHADLDLDLNGHTEKHTHKHEQIEEDTHVESIRVEDEVPLQITTEKITIMEDGDSGLKKKGNARGNSVFYLNLFSDMSHSFSNGILLSSSFKSGKNQGISTTMALLIHEIPHIMGDYALFMQKYGFSFSQCVQQHFISSLSTLAGVGFNHLVFNETKKILKDHPQVSKIPSVILEPTLLQKFQNSMHSLVSWVQWKTSSGGGVSQYPPVSAIDTYTLTSSVSNTTPYVFNILYSSTIFQKLPEIVQTKIISFTNTDLLKYNEILIMGLSCGSLFYMIFNNILPEIANPKGYKDLLLQICAISLGFGALFLL
ncbi:hypothetical protein ACO0QE_004483 [Hanseniaspora vineae]